MDGGIMSSIVRRLEQALCCWEDMSFCMSVSTRRRIAQRKEVLFPLVGPLEHAQTFRRYLLDSDKHPLFDVDRFINSATFGYMAGLENLPFELYCWTRASRRVFALTEELQDLLDATSLDGVLIGEIPLPFESFAITLARPLVDEKGVEYDCILMSRYLYIDTQTGLNMATLVVRIFSTQLEGIPHISTIDRMRVQGQMRQRRWDEAFLFTQSFQKSVEGVIIGGQLDFNYENVKNSSLSEPVLSLLQRSIPGAEAGIEAEGVASHLELLYSALRIAAGTCLYLASLPPQDHARITWGRVPRVTKQDSNAITKEAEVCTVKSVHRLSKDEREVLIGWPRRHREVCSHFRRGHWRRLQEVDGTVRRTWVRPCLVRGDRLSSGSLPGGSKSEFK